MSFCGESSRPWWMQHLAALAEFTLQMQEHLGLMFHTDFSLMAPWDLPQHQSLTAAVNALQDRHNGNTLMDDVGHIIHMHFGCIPSNSPGGVSSCWHMCGVRAPLKAAVNVLQDRHNGNILMDDAGHIIHIDFGFMLSNSPGGVNFEAAPFKLTRELLEIMDSNSEGHASEVFDYFKVRLYCLLELSSVFFSTDLACPGS